MALAAALFAITMPVLHYGSFIREGYLTLNRLDAIIMILIAVGVILASIGAALSEVTGLVALAAMGSVFLFAHYFGIFKQYDGYGAGFWVPSVVAFFGAGGGLIALVGATAPGREEAIAAYARAGATARRAVTVARGPADAARATTEAGSAGASGGWPTATTTSLPPAGWYPDPLAQAEQRYWDGVRWTEATNGAVSPGG
jgi:hypothetical protein